MTRIIAIANHKGGVDAVGLQKGQLVEASPGPDGSMILRQQVILDKNSFDALLKRRIEEAEVAVKEGRVLGPFDDARFALRAVKKGHMGAVLTESFTGSLIESPPGFRSFSASSLLTSFATSSIPRSMLTSIHN